MNQIPHRRAILAIAVLAAVVTSGCGLEGLLNQYAGTQYTQPLTTITGKVALPDPRFVAVTATGEVIEAHEWEVDEEGNYRAGFPAASYSGIRLRAIQGNAVLESLLPGLAFEETLEGVDVDARSTAASIILQGMMVPTGRTLAELSDDLVCITDKKLEAAFDLGGPGATLIRMIERALTRTNLTVTSTTLMLQSPRVDVAYDIIDSPLNSSWLQRAVVDYDGDGIVDQTTAKFDAVYAEALQLVEISAPPDLERVRVVFEVDFNEGKVGGYGCAQINRFKWVRDEPGKQMYFVGGIHQSSPVQDTVIDAMLGNRGGWTPNQIRMSDDGINGDRAAGDNIWTIYFDLPRGLRLGYKYTWGKQGDLWTGTEEWPGNQRILEIVDVNDDGYVYRFDNFGDEASNKDLANGHPASGGSLSWDEALKAEGYPEAQEGPTYRSAGCELDPLITPDWVPALTMACEDFVAQAE